MKTNEFIKKVNELGFNVIEKQYTYANEEWLIVREVEHTPIMSVEKNTRFLIDMDYTSFIYLDGGTREELFNLAIEYARTPVEEREEEKIFIVPLPGLVTTDGKCQYLSHAQDTFFASRRNTLLRQTWKEKDLKHLPEAYIKFAVEVRE